MIFPRLFGEPTKLDFNLPDLCSNCGEEKGAVLIEVPLNISRYGLRIVEEPGFIMNVPLCKHCAMSNFPRPVAVCGIKSKFFTGKVTKIFLSFTNHNFAQEFKSHNRKIILSGHVQVIDVSTHV